MRKQLLLGSTALIVGALAAPDSVAAEEPLRLEVRGFKNEFFGIGDVDVDNKSFNNTGEFSDGEIQFRGETALDNGLTVGVQVELETDSRGDQIDENYIFVKGDFGKIVAGSENLSNYNTFWGVTAPGVGIPLNSGWITTFVPAPDGFSGSFRSTIFTTNIDIGNDENSISYYSPRFSGFQFTAGYAPTVVDSGEGKTFGGFQADESFEYSNAWGVGMNFSESFNGVDVNFAAGYNQIEEPDNVTTAGGDSVQQFKIGAGISVGGFSIGGSYANEFEGKIVGPGTAPGLFARSEEGQSYDAGVSYSTGPWGVSVTYFHGEWEAAPGGGDDETDAIVGGVSYALGPGITASASVLYGVFENEDDGTSFAGDEGKATMGIVGLSVKF
jgi:predicted porin